MTNFDVTESWEWAEGIVSSGLDENDNAFADQYLFQEDIVMTVVNSDPPTVCYPLTVEAEPTTYTVSICGGPQPEYTTGRQNREWPLVELWWPVTEDTGIDIEVPAMEFQLAAGAGDPDRPGGYTDPLSLYDSAAAVNATVLLDISRADGRFVAQYAMTVTDAAAGKIELPTGITIGHGDYVARFTCVYSYQTLSVPTVPFKIYVREVPDNG